MTSPQWKTQLYGVAGVYAFGEFSIDATLPDPEVTFRLIREDGKTMLTFYSQRCERRYSRGD